MILISTLLEFQQIEDWFTAPLALDIETNTQGFPVGCSLASSMEEVYLYGPSLHQLLERAFQLQRMGWITHYGLADFDFLYKMGLYLQVGFDTYAAARLIHYDRMKGFSLKELAHEHLGYEDHYLYEGQQVPWNIHQFARDGRVDVASFPPLQQAAYCCRDAQATLGLYNYYKPLLQVQGIRELHRVESKLMPIIGLMQMRGMPFSQERMYEIQHILTGSMNQLHARIQEFTPGMEISSSGSVASWLYDKLHLPTGGIKRGKQHYSTDADSLDKIKDQHPVVSLIQEYRSLSSLMSTYSTNYINSARKHGGRVHTQLESFGAATGRLSSSGENLQNVPNHGYGRIVRKAFLANPGWKILSFDFKQLQLYILAVFSGDEHMLDLFRQGKDIHARTAAVIYHVPQASVSKPQRDAAKAINFAMAFLAGPGIFMPYARSWTHAVSMYQDWMEEFPGVKAWQDSLINYLDRGITYTWYGRMRQIPRAAPTDSEGYRGGVLRQLCNSPIQGTEGDLIKMAMVASDQALKSDPILWKNCHMLLPIHDELVFEVRDEYLPRAARVIQQAMEACSFPLPLHVDGKWGQDWYAMMEIDKYKILLDEVDVS